MRLVQSTCANTARPQLWHALIALKLEGPQIGNLCGRQDKYNDGGYERVDVVLCRGGGGSGGGGAGAGAGAAGGARGGARGG